MAWKCIIPDRSIEDVRDDRKNSVRIEQYRVSPKAIYFNGQYLPISEIREVKVIESSYMPGMSCGKGIPIYKLRIDYGAEKPLVLMIEKEKNVKTMMDELHIAYSSTT